MRKCVITAFCLVAVLSMVISMAVAEDKACKTNNPVTYTGNVVKETAKVVGDSVKGTTDVVTGETKNIAETVTGQPEKVKDTIIDPITGTATVIKDTVEATLNIPAEAAK